MKMFHDCVLKSSTWQCGANGRPKKAISRAFGCFPPALVVNANGEIISRVNRMNVSTLNAQQTAIRHHYVNNSPAALLVEGLR